MVFLCKLQKRKSPGGNKCEAYENLCPNSELIFIQMLIGLALLSQNNLADKLDPGL